MPLYRSRFPHFVRSKSVDGTAAVISPVGQLAYNGTVHTIADGLTEPGVWDKLEAAGSRLIAGLRAAAERAVRMLARAGNSTGN